MLSDKDKAELEEAKARLKQLRDAETEILIKGQEVEGEENTKLKRGNLATIQKTILVVKDEIEEIESRDIDSPDCVVSEVRFG
ncbi:hypothetical protein P7F88_24980 [Vibrio hannami]|uniref:hypothetical protein n=1 Tax=Vibrio hannami TaxID=2717094 RepID=UPI00240F5A6D|nr:hypothetical protein [Vibrio hannami]MDG3089118.1 hypothetical protein [Vibrio hannami]